jgi:crotonobetainyl-CoA:carnitine CoA-transferase CaiB-like acyl-CoA transferase
MTACGFPYEEMAKYRPDLIHLQSSGFGWHGPYRDYKSFGPVAAAVASITHMGGLPDDYPTGFGYSYMDVQGGWFAAMLVMAALRVRDRTGKGQYIEASVHEACANANEFHTSYWLADQYFRGRRPQAPTPRTKDARYVMPFLVPKRSDFDKFLALLDRDGYAEDLKAPEFADEGYLASTEGLARLHEAAARYAAAHTAEELLHAGQAAGLTWAPVRAPEDNFSDAHNAGRGNFVAVAYPELGATLTHPARGWIAPDLNWRVGPRSAARRA